MKVKEIMFQPLTVDSQDFVTKARAILQKRKEEYVIVTEKEKPTGVIDIKDLFRISSQKANIICGSIAQPVKVKVSTEEFVLDASKKMLKSDSSVALVGERTLAIDYFALLRGFLKKRYKPMSTIKKITRQELVDINTPISKVLLKLKKYYGIPIVSKKRLMGVVTRADYLRHAELRGVGKHLGEVMTSPAIAIQLNSRIEDAARKALRKRLTVLPVLENKKAVGMVTIADLVAAYVR